MSRVVDAIATIYPGKDNWKVKARVISVWENRSSRNPNVISSLELILIDEAFTDGIKDLTEIASGVYLRRFFVDILLWNSMSRPSFVWNTVWKLLAEDIKYNKRVEAKKPDMIIHDEDLKLMCLIEIEKMLLVNGKSLDDYPGMPHVDKCHSFALGNPLILQELDDYDKQDMLLEYMKLFPLLNEEQLSVYNKVIHAIENKEGGFFFVYGYGGTGKTFIWKLLSCKLRSEGMIVLNVVSSGIVALLLPGGRTAHSRFSIPITLTEDSTCNIDQSSFKADLIRQCKLIIWDEAPMVNKWAFEALDRSLRDIMSFVDVENGCRPFGGKIVVFGGDFRQILPIVRRSNRAGIVMATINSSLLWKHCQVLELTKNMRLQPTTEGKSKHGVQAFVKWILSIGKGDNQGSNDGESDICIPSDLLIENSQDYIGDIVRFTYPNLLNNLHEHDFFRDRAILAPTLEVVDIS